MLKFSQITPDDQSKNYIPSLNGILFSLTIDGKIVGYARLENIENNPIEIYVLQQYRGNGYGTVLYKNILAELKKSNLKDFKTSIDKENYIMTRILEKNGALKISTINGINLYIIK